LRSRNRAAAGVRQEGIELAGGLQRVQLVRSADAVPIDEDLRHGAPAARAPDHLLAPARMLPEIDLDELDPLAIQQALGP
jgi:hypothetical protein